MASPASTGYVQANTLAVTDTGDFIQIRNGSDTRIEVIEVRVWQTSDTALAMNAVRLHRGVSGAAGTGLTEREWDNQSGTLGVTGFSMPTTDVGTLSLDIHSGWNILQEWIWLPTPEMPLILMNNEMLGVSLLIADTLTIGVSITWQTYGTA